MTVFSAPTAPTHELPGARFTTLASPSRGSAETSVWRLELRPDAEAVPHQVTREEIFVALEGAASATLDGVATPVRAGDTLVLSPGIDFSIVATGPEAFHALVCLPVGGAAVTADGSQFTPPWAL